MSACLAVLAFLFAVMSGFEVGQRRYAAAAISVAMVVFLLYVRSR